jgi:hypothetical protein
MLEHRIFLTAIVGLALSAAPLAMDAQRCSATPTYSSRRVSAGAYNAGYRRGEALGGLLRGVFGDLSLEARQERFDAFWYEPYQDFVGGSDAPIAGRTTGLTFRQSRPLMDGAAALCVIVDYSATSIEWTETFVTNAREHRELGFGLGIAVPVRMSSRINTSLLFEMRRVSHRVDWNDCCDSGTGSAIGSEVVAAAGVEILRGMVATMHVSSPFYDRRSNAVPKWREYAVPKLRLGLVYSFDLR